ncbi:MAG TPA: response regulator [Longimicrobiales bacterium]|nr:response regulator [Longimicrobiales bacterium]
MAGLNWILLVEDEADHRVLVREVLRRVAERIPLHEVVDGAEAMAWMRSRVANPEQLEGGLVILDLGLPRASGFQVLEWMREMPPLCNVPVVILTASENPMDADHAFNLGARGYFQKPADFRRYLEIFQKVFNLASVPTAGSPSP